MLVEMEGDGPLYVRLYTALKRQIVEGRFPAGKRLPGTRSIARALGVSRTVVLRAYEQLESEGYTVTRVGSGTYVIGKQRGGGQGRAVAQGDAIAESVSRRKCLPDIPLSRLAKRVPDAPVAPPSPAWADTAPRLIDLSDAGMGYDVQSLKAWRHMLARVTSDLPLDLPRTDDAAMELSRTALDFLHRERGVEAQVEDVIVVNSTQQARDLIARVLVDEGTIVGVEEPCSPGVRRAFAAAGASVVPCAVDADGLDVDAHAASLHAARVVHVAPTCHPPTGALMPAARRAALLKWVYDHPVWVVEEDVGRGLDHNVRVMPALVSEDPHGRVIYYTSDFAHMLYPAVQLACVVVPPRLRRKFRAIKALGDHDGTTLSQLAWARYLADGEHARGVRRLSRQLTHKCRQFVAALQRHFGAAMELRGRGMPGQLLVYLPALGAQWTTILCEESLRAGLRIESAAAWFDRRPDCIALLLHYASVPDALLDVAVERLVHAYHRALADVKPPQRLSA